MDMSAGGLEFGDLGVDPVEDGFEPPSLRCTGDVAAVGGVEGVDDFVQLRHHRAR